jgi:phosphoribosylglycinamide formyltransferase-1
MKKIAVLFSGTGSTFDYLATHLHNQKCIIELALTNNPKAKGIEVAQKHHIPVKIIDSSQFETRELFDTEVVQTLQSQQLNLTVLAGFMRILTPTFTEQIKAINLHPSLLPRHKGLHAIERSYEDNHTHGGVSVHWVTSELDSGEIILQKSIEKSTLSFEAYYKAIRVMEKETLKEALLQLLSTDQ